MSTTVHDIYDPPPAPVAWNPKPEPLVFTAGDLACLVTLCATLFLASVLFWSAEPGMALLTALGGSVVILESWFTALGFLHRCRPLGLRARWTIFLAALVPWLIGIGSAVAFMAGLFLVADWLG
jgi:hypothetical protein